MRQARQGPRGVWWRSTPSSPHFGWGSRVQPTSAGGCEALTCIGHDKLHQPTHDCRRRQATTTLVPPRRRLCFQFWSSMSAQASSVLSRLLLGKASRSPQPARRPCGREGGRPWEERSAAPRRGKHREKGDGDGRRMWDFSTGQMWVDCRWVLRDKGRQDEGEKRRRRRTGTT